MRSQYLGKTVTMGVRPEHLVEASRLGAAGTTSVPVTIDIVEQLGNENFIYLLNGSTLLTARMAPDLRVQRGDQASMRLRPQETIRQHRGPSRSQRLH